MENKYFVFVLLFLLVASPVMAKDLTGGEIDEMLLKPDLRTLEPKQVEISDRLDSSYILEDTGVYFKDLKQTDPIVWIDYKDGDETYHVDSRRDFIENESVTLKFFYSIQPDSITHFTHSGKLDRTFFPPQWNWTPNCASEEDCAGGFVTLEVQNIEEGLGSSTFPISITGPIWARQSQDYGEFNGLSSLVNSSSGVNLAQNFTYSVWVNSLDMTADSGYSRRIIRGNNNNRPYLGVHTTGVFEFSVANSSGYTHSILSSSVSVNQWYSLVGVYNNDTQNLTLYLNSVFQGTTNLGSKINDYSNVNIILGYATPTQGRLNGSIDEVLIYNRSLSQAEVTLLYANYSVTSTGINRTGTPSTEGLVLDINFDDYSVADNSGSGNHGTNTNVSFGIVENVLKTLTATTDYTINPTTGLFTIVNDDYSWAWMNASYDYRITNNRNLPANTVLHLIEFFIGLSFIGLAWLFIRSRI